LKTLIRLHSGVPGLDALTEGGFIAGASYLIQGRPGSGKTILANQIAFNHARAEGKAIFASLLSEPHDHLLQFLSTLSFFDHTKVGDSIFYISAFEVLENEGLDEVVKVLRREIVRNKASLLILDGLLNARSQAETPIDTKKFVAELQMHAAFMGCTIIFLTSAEIEQGRPELTMVDGVISLFTKSTNVHTQRQVEIHKLRGSGYLSGQHEYWISKDGIAISPRIEERFRVSAGVPGKGFTRRICSGVSGLDRTLNGGLLEGSATLFFGPSGCGKTTLGLNFVCSIATHEKALIVSLYEDQDQLVLKANELKMHLESLIDSSGVKVEWQPTSGFRLDDMASRILDTVRKSDIKRVFIDSLSALTRQAGLQGRLVEFVSALLNELRALGATLYLSWETSGFPNADIQSPPPEICSIVDNIFMLSFSDNQDDASPFRLSVVKCRHSLFDRRANSVVIREGGIHFSGTSQTHVIDPLSKV